ncbi:MAG TPA: radical SAM protein [Anaerolineae bacterium]|nr:radical SAM protein [Anaerolineae bacterium]
MKRPEPQTLTAWLHVTNACNLRCTYCYLNKTNSAIDEAVGRAAVDAIVRSALRHDFQTVKLKYAGGEATLNFPLVMALHHYAKTRAAEYGLQLREVVLSNGIGLTPSMFDFMHNENIRLMISLDGIGAAHDAQRVFANGKGSFLQVSRSIERALARGLSPHLSITVTAHNADSLADAVVFALDRDLLFNLNFFRENECAAGFGDLRAGEAKLIAGMRRAFAVIEERLPRRSLIGALVDRSAFNSPHDRACGAGHSYLVIDEKGGVARCQMEIEKTVADVFVEDPLLAVREVRDGFQNIPVDQKEGCRDCEWRYWCAGGCSLLTFKMTGRSDIQSPNCNIYKALYPDVLRLEGLRLLKWANLPVQ